MTFRSLCIVNLILIMACSGSAWVQEKPSAAPARLLTELKSKDRGNRRDAANELGAMRARGALRALVEALSDKEAKVREAAAFALGQIADRTSTSVITGRIRERGWTGFAVADDPRAQTRGAHFAIVIASSGSTNCCSGIGDLASANAAAFADLGFPCQTMLPPAHAGRLSHA